MFSVTAKLCCVKQRCCFLTQSGFLVVNPSPLLQVVQLCRQLSNRELERSHIFLLYGALCDCINSKEHRVRELAKDTLQLAGTELCLTIHDKSTEAST